MYSARALFVALCCWKLTQHCRVKYSIHQHTAYSSSDLNLMMQAHALQSPADVPELTHKVVLRRAPVCNLTLKKHTTPIYCGKPQVYCCEVHLTKPHVHWLPFVRQGNDAKATCQS